MHHYPTYGTSRYLGTEGAERLGDPRGSTSPKRGCGRSHGEPFEGNGEVGVPRARGVKGRTGAGRYRR